MRSVGRNDDCPCGSRLKFKKCCGHLMEGGVASTPEALMRSRYSAYVIGAVDYLFHTTHPDNPALDGRTLTSFRQELLAYCRQTDFVGLTILDAPTPEPFQTGKVEYGQVHFVARWKYIGKSDAPEIERTGEQEERSYFVKENGRWLWLGEEAPVTLPGYAAARLS